MKLGRKVAGLLLLLSILLVAPGAQANMSSQGPCPWDTNCWCYWDTMWGEFYASCYYAECDQNWCGQHWDTCRDFCSDLGLLVESYYCDMCDLQCHCLWIDK